MLNPIPSYWGFLGRTSGKESACQCRRPKRHRFNPWVGKIPKRRAQEPTAMLLARESLGQRSLAGYSPQGHKESDAIEVTENAFLHTGLPRWHNGEESACQCGRCKRCRFDPQVRKIPWSRKWQPIPVFLPGKFHGQRSLAGNSPQGHKQLDTTEPARTYTCTVD